MSPHFSERALFRAASFFERETGYWRELPWERGRPAHMR
jgi:hypothetical protein